MRSVPQIEPVSQLQKNYRVVLDQLAAGPVVLSSQGRATAVVVSVADWDDREARLRMLEALHEARRVEALTNEAGSWIPWASTKAKAKANAAVAD